MPETPEVVLTLRGVAYWQKWRQTLRLARRLIKSSPSPWQRTRTRLHGFLPIRRPVFILGCPRSGTTFLGEVLEALPTASYYFEPPAMKYYSRLVYERKVTFAQARRFYRRGFQALLLASPGKGPRIIEKNPTHTWIAETLYQIFPDALFVIISRDGRDTALSLVEKPWHLRESLATGKREPGEYLYGPYPHFYIEPERAEEYTATSDLHRCIWIWRRFTEEVQRLKTALPASVQCHFRYEEFVMNQEASVDRLLTFLGETDAESRRCVLEAAARGHGGSIGRWRKKLREDDLQIIDREAGDLMRQLGYV